MNTKTTLQAAALSLALAFTAAAHAGDFDDNYPLFIEAQAHRGATPAQVEAQQVAATAATLKRLPGRQVSTEASRAMLGEDSGSFWLTQHPAHPRSAAAVAKLEAGMR